MKHPDLQLLRQPPVIIVGMHRSGTTMVARILEECGIFMGSRKERNCEALFFLKLNNWLLSQAGASWDNPMAFNALLQHSELVEQLTSKLKAFLTSFKNIDYLGLNKFLRWKSLYNMPDAWGWKDPRNTFTLPFWQELFPNAQIIHVYRHGVDVAASLNKRNQVFFSNYPQKSSTKIHNNFFLSRNSFYRLAVEPTPHCFDLEASFSLWEQYMRQLVGMRTKSSNAMYEVKYEDLLMYPSQELGKLLHHIKIPIKDEKISAIVKTVDSDRGYAYKKKPELAAFASKNSDRLAQYGYSH